MVQFESVLCKRLVTTGGERSGNLIDRHLVRDPAQGRVLLGRREPAHLQKLRDLRVIHHRLGRKYGT